MSKGWMRIREAAHLMGVSQTTVRRRVDSEELRGRTGESGRQEVFLPVKLRRELEAAQAKPCPPGHRDRGKTPEEQDAEAKANKQEPKPGKTASKTPVTKAATDKQEKPTGTDPSEDGGDLVKRYERLAGGSLILAQQHSDAVTKQSAAAYEQLAHTRSQVRHLRKIALAGWASCAAVLALMLVLTVTLGMGKARAEAAASASELQAERAERRAQTMNNLLSDANSAPAAQTPTASELPSVLSMPSPRLHGPTAEVPSE